MVDFSSVFWERAPRCTLIIWIVVKWMLSKAKQAVGEGRVTYDCKNVLTDALPGAGYDLVTTHFLFDCFTAEEQFALAERIAAKAPKARWLVSEFRVPRHGWPDPPRR